MYGYGYDKALPREGKKANGFVLHLVKFGEEGWEIWKMQGER